MKRNPKKGKGNPKKGKGKGKECILKRNPIMKRNTKKGKWKGNPKKGKGKRNHNEKKLYNEKKP